MGSARGAGRGDRAAASRAAPTGASDTGRSAGARRPDTDLPGEPVPRKLLVGLSLALAVATLAVYAQVASFDFVAYDDRSYILETPEVRSGLTWHGLVWALRAFHLANWHPLTWISHMLDVTLFGLAPAGPHVVNLLLHVGTTCLLFVWLAGTTAKPWRSALVAGLFALHPLHVESVAWVAERKDVLGALFWIATLLAYVRYARAPGRGPYLLTLGLFALGLAAKPMLVTVPFTLLLLDYWPLRRGAPGARKRVERPPVGEPSREASGDASGDASRQTSRQASRQASRYEGDPRAFLERLPALAAEKTPFFVLSVLACVLTVRAQSAVGVLASTERFPIAARAANSVVSYARYLADMAWPSGLAAFYPRPETWPAWEVLLAASIVSAANAAALFLARRLPWLTFGWFWYVGTLVPVIGLVQVGLQARADRYTYVPSIGIFVVAAWGASEAADRARIPARARLAAGLAVLGACAALTWRQAGFWRNTETLFRRALEVTVDNPVAHNVLGNELAASGRLDEAIAHFETAERIIPSAATSENLGLALAMKGRFVDATAQYREGLRLEPARASLHAKLGEVLDHEGYTDEAVAQYEEALRLDPAQPTVHNNLGACLAQRGHFDEAIAHYEEALRQRPDYADAAGNLASSLAASGRTAEALERAEQVVRLRPGNAGAQSSLADLLLALGRAEEAAVHYEAALRLRPGDPAAAAGLSRARARLTAR